MADCGLRYCEGVLRTVEGLLLIHLKLLLYMAIVVTGAGLSKPIAEARSNAPTVASSSRWSHDHSEIAPAAKDLPLPVPLPIINGPYRKHFSPHPSPTPAQSPNYGSLTTHGHPPSSPHLSKPLKKTNHSPAPHSEFPPLRLVALSPNGSGIGNVPSGLSQPPLSPTFAGCCKGDMVPKQANQGCHCVYPIKLELLLLDVSLSSNWSSEFLKELASQLALQVSQFEITNFYVLGPADLNITMDITPHTGISFSESDMSRMNSSLSMHRVHLDSSFVGDYKLLNFTWFKPPAPSPAPGSGLSPLPLPRSHPNYPNPPAADNGGDRSILIIFLSLVGGILMVIVISVSIVYAYTKGQDKKKALPANDVVKPKSGDTVSREGSLPHPASTRFLAYEELKEATNNFEPASMLGEGGFGRVFKGVLNDGTPVAIKKLTTGGHQGDKEFLVEVEMLSRLHHRNLVKLVGYYCNRDSSQNLLCYELVPNGSLEAWLHGPLGANCPLDWETRMKIALDAARGLAYLHEDSQPCVIHRDFKASNILLENTFLAKVADFGLAKLAPEGGANYLSTRVMGTFGYVAPEYAMTGHLLVKSDVYSYGVVLLELLSGRKPVDMLQPSGQENLVTWARPILSDKDRLEELADPKLEGRYPKDDFARVCTIAAACVAPEANQRPTMGEVVQSLKMVQRVVEHQDSTVTTSNPPNLRQSSTTYESDGSSSMFSSGPFSGVNPFETDNISRTAVFSEDLHEGR
ncbi:probable serine/threonine-protein kinase PBL10 isoform X2 [Aristolochia californica]|uniref:probable serine/threonine-protein kinase PBL10 isoform X2 n=1 Tax=Aristolochia californica TaxID=171875 RepID=UPI0035E16A18